MNQPFGAGPSAEAEAEPALAELRARTAASTAGLPAAILEPMLRRDLREAKGDVERAAELVQNTMEWRRSGKYREDSLGCAVCRAHPGAHPWRQVGFDKQRRPAVYICFAQGTGHADGSCEAFYEWESVLPHIVHTMDNAQLSCEKALPGERTADSTIWARKNENPR
mmetsp:Transcript_44259/g.100038  ORF Transcript_44259/g.100038 Transcript_44259/m.100038 type:complete len:167 (-) Transcript_44259:81-581(-)